MSQQEEWVRNQARINELKAENAHLLAVVNAHNKKMSDGVYTTNEQYAKEVKEHDSLLTENAAQTKRIQDLEGEDKISAAVIDRCVNLLAQIAITLKGEPKELTRHSYHDLPELVSILHLENELHKAKIDDLEQDLQFIERWANHHGTKPNVTAQEALSCIQHYPSIAAITKSYKDGAIPNTRNPYAEIEAQANRIAELEAAVKANHEWHQEHDDYDGYQESALYTTNTSTLSALKTGAEDAK